MEKSDIPNVTPLLGSSRVHEQVLKTLDRVARSNANVLLSGPVGTRKVLYAIYLHQRSHRARAPFIAVNGSNSAGPMENGLFGPLGGECTGVRPQVSGLIEAAEGGTLFFQEIDSLPLSTQTKVLRFLGDREYRRLGETRVRRADVRVVAATSGDLVKAGPQNTFRQDLLSRLADISIAVPSLAERGDDIPALLDEFARQYAEAYQMPRIVMSERAMDQARNYAWPGNISELENCVRYLTRMQLSRPVDPHDLPVPDPQASVLFSRLSKLTASSG